MNVLAMVYPRMTLLDLVGPLQAWSFLPRYDELIIEYAPQPRYGTAGLIWPMRRRLRLRARRCNRR
jgi:hypothetical protein